MPDAVLEVASLTRRYTQAAAVDGVSFDIPRGEVLCLLGPSGCGKSTILRVIAGIDTPDGGEVRIDGRVMASAGGVFVPPEKRNVGLVFQSYAIWPHMTVAQNVSYPLEVRHVAKADIARKVSDVLRVVGLGGVEHRPATHLSGGQQQRVALARALVYSPRLLLLDEPLSNLDARLRDELRNEIKRIQRELGLTVLYVTHDQLEAMTLADRIAVMRNGRIVQIGTPREIYDAPASVFVQGFFGKTYVLRGTLRCHAHETRVALESGASFPVAACGDIADATEISVSIRAEDMTLAERDAPDGPDIVSIPAQVRDVRFLGDRLECLVTSGGTEIYVECPRSFTVAAGDAVALRIPRSRIGVWTQDGATPALRASAPLDERAASAPVPDRQTRVLP
jgi:ABC-type Fe3+/spermidine/putrescine transport system ATPase subunit